MRPRFFPKNNKHNPDKTQGKYTSISKRVSAESLQSITLHSITTSLPLNSQYPVEIITQKIRPSNIMKR